MNTLASKLSYKQRKKLPDSCFAYIKVKKDGTKVRKYPIVIPGDEKSSLNHARNALARVSHFGTPKMKSIVRKAVYKLYPQFKKSKKMAASVSYDALLQNSDNNFKVISNIISLSGKDSKVKLGNTSYSIKCANSVLKLPLVDFYADRDDFSKTISKVREFLRI
jgi:hypothetical protein